MANTSTPTKKPETKAADDFGQVKDAAVTALKEYAQKRPEVVGLWIFGLGFVIGWKLKPW